MVSKLFATTLLIEINLIELAPSLKLDLKEVAFALSLSIATVS
jgi:hypothetical protein